MIMMLSGTNILNLGDEIMSKEKDKIVFTFEVGDKEEELAIRKPTAQEVNEGQKEYMKAWREAYDSGAFMRVKMKEILESQGVWGPEKEVKFRELTSEIARLEKEFHDGGLKSKFYSTQDGKPTGKALELRKLRRERRELQVAQLEGNDHTIEGRAENKQFNFLLSQCLVYNKTGKKFWANYEDFINRLSEPVAMEALKHFNTLMYGLDEDFEGKLPENKFLKQFGYVDEKYRLVNKDGNLIDEEGRLINESGQYVNESGQVVDILGNPISEDGEYVGEQKPFIDDEEEDNT